MTGIALRPLLTLTIETARGATHIGQTPNGYARRVVFVTGGRFEGQDLAGRVLPGGGDFLILRPDGAMNLDVRLVLETDAGELIYLTYVGRRNGPAAVMEKYRKSEPVAPGEDYFRTLVQFETAAPRLARLNDILAVGRGHRLASGPVYEIFEIL